MSTTKIALLTGGSRGLGKDMALKLAQQGIDVILTYRSQQTEAAAVVVAIEALGRRAVALPLNVADTSTFEAFFAQVTKVLADTFGTDKFDFLINNAGTGLLHPFAETTEAQFDELLNQHFKGVYFLTQRALALLRDGGRIINITSLAARVAYAGNTVYASVKGALEVFTRQLALELGSRGIAVNAVAPGAVFGGGAMPDTPEMRDYILQATALGRTAEPDDIGGIVAFLCSDAARWINGQRLEASGGVAL
ncbi:SDR family NAD(P)-dependent oxidoreductase [Hymenobacter volaticus]|uniref:SDR family oxidoreductase n=1 Tax=Hymenobacter volaticus TaxID=2932254 RepID=A0ABY4GEP0_9BACT|nr:SDR family oxidoreductase [Hymenobacter volaticus]UOQ69260.1 SDR family oxidoreductase [Hymenobacter volaticus]